jgi:hypothetical protein
MNDGGYLSAEQRRSMCRMLCRRRERSHIRGDPKVADGQSEGQSTHAPKHSSQDGVPESGRRGLPQQYGQIWHEQQCKGCGRDNPCSEALNDPVDLPRTSA